MCSVEWAGRNRRSLRRDPHTLLKALKKLGYTLKPYAGPIVGFFSHFHRAGEFQGKKKLGRYLGPLLRAHHGDLISQTSLVATHMRFLRRWILS